MILGIDAHNLRGGGITHLYNLLKHGNFVDFEKIYIFVHTPLERMLQEFHSERIEIITEKILDSNLLKRVYWNNFVLPKRIKTLKIEMLFSPSGLLPMRPFQGVKTITMFRNFEVFQRNYSLYKKAPLYYLRFFLLRKAQLRSFSYADGIIFLCRHGKTVIEKKIKGRKKYSTIISHGINESFFRKPQDIDLRNKSRIHILYVSTIFPYKHHREVIEAIFLLEKRHEVTVTFVGGGDKSLANNLKKYVRRIRLKSEVKWLGDVPYNTMSQIYAQCDVFVFASSSENCPNILLEAMASGLPIACANSLPMPEFAQNGVEYFDPTKSESIFLALMTLIEKEGRAKMLSQRAFTLAQKYSWDDRAKKTLDFIREVYEDKDIVDRSVTIEDIKKVCVE